MVAITLVAIVFIPLALGLIQRVFDIRLQMSAAGVWGLVAWSLLAPLVVGVVIHQLSPRFADRASEPVARAADILLLVAIIPIVIKVWPAVWSQVGNGTVVVMLVFALLALASGHFLGGPDPEDRTVLALSSAFRHPGIALAIAHANFPDEKLAPAAVILFVLVSGIAAKPYLAWTARHHPPVVGQVSPRSA